MRPRNGRVLVRRVPGVSLHLGAPVWLVRLAFAAAALAFGAGVIAYVFLWMFMPVGDPVAAAQAMSDAASTGFAEPLSRGNAAYAGTAGDSGRSDADDSSEGLAAALRRAPKPSLVALAGLVFIAISVLLSFCRRTGADRAAGRRRRRPRTGMVAVLTRTRANCHRCLAASCFCSSA